MSLFPVAPTHKRLRHGDNGGRVGGGRLLSEGGGIRWGHLSLQCHSMSWQPGGVTEGDGQGELGAALHHACYAEAATQELIGDLREERKRGTGGRDASGGRRCKSEGRREGRRES